MKVLTSVEQFRQWRASVSAEHPVAFVPTMGFLHDGHLALLRLGREKVGTKGVLVLSIFVNPTQFNNAGDLELYPRDEAGDLEKARSSGVDAVFLPKDPRELYPSELTWVEVQELDRELCGATRPGHFRGVCTVVAKLWNLVRPDVAVFGEKDFQQLAIIRRMHKDLFLTGEVVGAPIVRETDGLAMSSRNVRLSVEERKQALALPNFLQSVASLYAAGERDVSNLLRPEKIEAALAPGQIDYVSIVDQDSLQPITKRVETPALLAAAVFYGDVRLIDNIKLA